MKPKYRFVGRDGYTLIRESVRPMRGDSRHEENRCGRAWFWRDQKPNPEIATALGVSNE